MRSVMLSLFLSAPLCAGMLVYDINLDATTQQVPPNASPGFGFAKLTLDDIANTLHIDLTYSGLTAPATNAHIHCCADPGSNAGVVLPFIPGGFLTGSTSGSFIADFSLTQTLVGDIESGRSYINIHTGNFPGGEIRGNITAATLETPEPGAAAMLLIGLAALWRRRRH